MQLRKPFVIAAAVSMCLLGGNFSIALAQELPTPIVKDGNNFYVSDKVQIKEVQFKNIYGMRVAGAVFTPKQMDMKKKYPAIVISHPFGAVRQQAANLYATKLAEEGFVTLAFDQSFWGNSEGLPRGSVLPDVYTENFSAGVDYLGSLSFVDREKIGALGICASGGFALAATKLDLRIKALATVSMYDMGEYYRSGINGDRSKETLMKDLERVAQYRWQSVDTNEPVYGPGQNDPVFVEAKESNDFYRTSRGFVQENDRRTTPVSYAKFMNFFPLEKLDSISPRPILFVVGEIAPSKSYTDKAYQSAAQPKELFVVKGANRTDLYDRINMIPWEKLSDFFSKNLSNN